MKELTNEQLIERIQFIRNKLYMAGRKTPTRSMPNEREIKRYVILNKRYLNMTFIYHMRNKQKDTIVKGKPKSESDLTIVMMNTNKGLNKE